MEKPAIYPVHPSTKKRLFPGGSSISKLVKQREDTGFEVICVDSDENSGDAMVIDEKANLNNKGKEALSSFEDNHSYSAHIKSGAQGHCKSSDSESCHDDMTCNDEYFMKACQDNLTYDRDEALQIYFDSRGIPPGDEAHIPWFLVPTHSDKPPSSVKSSHYSNSTLQIDSGKLNTPFNLDLTLSESDSSAFSNPRPEMGSLSYPSTIRTQLSSPSYHGKYTPSTHGSTAHYSSHSQADIAWPSYGFGSSYMASYAYSSSMESIGNNDLPYPLAPPKFSLPSPTMPPPPSSMGTHVPLWLDGFSASRKPPFANDHIISPMDALPVSYKINLSYQFPHDPGSSRKSAIAAGSSSAPLLPMTNVNEKDILEKFQNFKQFDTVDNFSDHHFQNSVSGEKRQPKNWVKRIQEEWKILEKNLPDTIHVRVCESRMDLLRAVIVGAEGTPYHDGLFFFDLSFPSDYPNVPPIVNYHSGGLGINPNLYSCGKVCLSLLNTWDGEHVNEQWIPNVSTILQVLVSIQALILNQKPYFNEPGFEDMDGTPIGEMESKQYNETVFTLSLRTMVYTIRHPPTHFEDFIVGHFFKHAQDILGACKVYLEGVQVGCLVNGGAQNIDVCKNSCSKYFSDLLASYIPTLVETFSLIGTKDLEMFLSFADKGNSQVSSVPLPFHFH